MTSVSFFFFLSFLFSFFLGGGGGCRAFGDCAVKRLYVTDLYHANTDTCQFLKIRAIKPWNHFHMCTVLLWTKVVVECIFPWGG